MSYAKMHSDLISLCIKVEAKASWPPNRIHIIAHHRTQVSIDLDISLASPELEPSPLLFEKAISIAFVLLGSVQTFEERIQC